MCGLDEANTQQQQLPLTTEFESDRECDLVQRIARCPLGLFVEFVQVLIVLRAKPLLIPSTDSSARSARRTDLVSRVYRTIESSDLLYTKEIFI